MARLLAVVLLGVSTLTAYGQQQPPSIERQSDEDISIQAFLQAVETAISTTDRAAWLNLLSPNADRDPAIEFYDSMVPSGVTRAVVRERDRSDLLGALPGEGYRLIAEIFIETGARGRILTWKLDIRRPRETTERQPWRLISHERLSTVDGLHRLSLHSGKQFQARDLVIRSVDFELRLPAGDVFVAEVAEGVTALVVMGDGTMLFTPGPAEERGQLRIYAGTDALETSFNAAFVRLNPYEFEQQLRKQALAPVAVDARAFRRGQAVFDEEVSKSFSLDLSDLSRDTWSLLPQAGDFLAEVRTRRFDTLTYARSSGEAEDVTLFHRQKKKNIAAYASPSKLGSRGRFYNEDDLVEYDVLDYDIDATFNPDRQWLEGRTRFRLRVKAYALGALTLKLAEEFTVRSINSTELGRLLFLRVRNQDSVVVNLPSAVSRDVELTLDVTYQGPFRGLPIDQETVAVQDVPQRGGDDLAFVPPEPYWLFSNRSHWYPQGQVTDYATARIRFTVPAAYAVGGSGFPLGSGPATIAPGPNGTPRVTYSFNALQPARYLGLIVSRMNRVDTATVALDVTPSGGSASSLPADTYLGGGRLASKPAPSPVVDIGVRNSILLGVIANKRQEARGRETLGTASEILRFYTSLVGDAPYDAMTVAMVEHNLPGGHSPPYLAVMHNPLPMSPFVWRHDPAAFSSFPEFFLAHELAHQWWGQAVGWKNYHEQWLSEGIAQYFAALFAKQRRGETAFRDVLRQFRKWGVEQSEQGPVFLGYRLGHLKNDSRVFRALVYNKSAGVLHMLRRLIGDDAFFRGLRRFYAENRYKKAGTADLERAMSAEAGRSLEPFFQRWIFESGIPRVRYSTVTEGQEIVVRFEQVAAPGGLLYEIPVTVSMHYGDKTVEEMARISNATAEARYPLAGSLRTVDINADGAAMAVFEKR